MGSKRVIQIIALACVALVAAGVAKAEEQEAAAAAEYVCPPCGCPGDSKPQSERGPCPDCGMAMVEAAAAEANDALTEDADGGWVCPPCGCADDDKAWTAQGQCPGCGMAMIKKMKFMNEVARVNIFGNERPKAAILLFPGVQIIDYTGPYEVFGQARFDVFTVASSKDTLRTNMGMQVTPHHNFEDAPKADVLIVPGGGVQNATNDEATLAWVRKAVDEAQYALTVCNGAFILAETGLLDGKRATTYYGLIDSLREAAPKVEVISDQRYVDNGKIITTAGLSSGIDGSLHVVSKMRSRALAQGVALNMEYDWKEDSNFARADFADRMLINRVLSSRHYPLLDAPESTWRLLSTRGDADRWKFEWSVETAMAPADLIALFDQKLKIDGGWTPADGQAGKASASSWRFRDDRQRAWRGALAAAKAENGKVKVSFDVWKADLAVTRR